jgi:hypothetical protein
MKCITLFILLILMRPVFGDVVLRDRFDDGTLATAPEATGNINGGFYEVTNDSGKDGASFEDSGRAVVVNGSTPNITGILSSGTVDMSLGAVTAWDIRGYDLAANSSYMALVWQTENDFTDQPKLSLRFDLINDRISFYANDIELEFAALDIAFSDLNGFSAISEFTPSGYVIGGYGIDPEGASGETNIVFSGTWGAGSLSFSELFSTEYHIGSMVNGKGNANVYFGIDEVSVDAIPEPAVLGLIVLFGSCLFGANRVFRSEPTVRKRQDPLE